MGEHYIGAGLYFSVSELSLVHENVYEHPHALPLLKVWSSPRKNWSKIGAKLVRVNPALGALSHGTVAIYILRQRY